MLRKNEHETNDRVGPKAEDRVKRSGHSLQTGCQYMPSILGEARNLSSTSMSEMVVSSDKHLDYFSVEFICKTWSIVRVGVSEAF